MIFWSLITLFYRGKSVQTDIPKHGLLEKDVHAHFKNEIAQRLIHNLRANVAVASNSVDGESAYAEAQELPADYSARAALERLKDSAE